MPDFKERDLFILANTTFPEWYLRHHTDGVAQIKEGKYDIFSFEGLTAEKAREAVAKGWLDLEEQQNSAPTVAEIIKFCEENPSFTAHGYVVTPTRNDVRISFEGVIATKKPSVKEKKNYREMFREADEYDTKFPFRAWFD